MNPIVAALIAVALLFFLFGWQGKGITVTAWIAGILAFVGGCFSALAYYASAYHPDPTGQSAGVILTPDDTVTFSVMMSFLFWCLPVIGLGFGTWLRGFRSPAKA